MWKTSHFEERGGVWEKTPSDIRGEFDTVHFDSAPNTTKHSWRLSDPGERNSGIWREQKNSIRLFGTGVHLSGEHRDCGLQKMPCPVDLPAKFSLSVKCTRNGAITRRHSVPDGGGSCTFSGHHRLIGNQYYRLVHVSLFQCMCTTDLCRFVFSRTTVCCFWV